MKTFDTPLHYFELRENYVFCQVKKSAYSMDLLAHSFATMAEIREILGGKYAMLVELKDSPPVDSEMRKYVIEEFSKNIHSVAFYGQKRTTRLFANIVFGFKRLPATFKVFETQDKGLVWLLSQVAKSTSNS